MSRYARRLVWSQNYGWNLNRLRQRGCIDPAFTGTPEQLAKAYADADTGEGIVRPPLDGSKGRTFTFDHRTGDWNLVTYATLGDAFEDWAVHRKVAAEVRDARRAIIDRYEAFELGRVAAIEALIATGLSEEQARLHLI